MTTLRALLAGGLLATACIAPLAAQDPPVSTIAPQRFVFSSVGGHTFSVPCNSTIDLTTTHPEIEHLVIMVHGSDRGTGYHSVLLDALKHPDAPPNVALISPQFLVAADFDVHDIEDTAPYWTGNGWTIGYLSRSDPGLPRPARLSSFAVIDALLRRAVEILPNLRQISLSGFSAGGQFINRYAAVNQIHTSLEVSGIDVSYVVGAPFGYLYLTSDRPSKTVPGTFGPVSPEDIAACPTYNEYRQGLENMPAYPAETSIARIREQYGRRRVTYLVGSNDNEPDDEDEACRTVLQGSSRVERAILYHDYLQFFYGPEVATRHRLCVVEGAIHSSRQVFVTPQGVEALFYHLGPPPSTVTDSWIYGGTSDGTWNIATNWASGMAPEANTHVVFNLTSASASNTSIINFDTGVIGSFQGVREIGAITLAASDTRGRIIRGNNNSPTGNGVLVLHGVESTEDGAPEVLLVANRAPGQLLAFRNGSNTVSRVGLPRIGVMRAAAGSTIELASPVENTFGVGGIDKRGPGILSFASAAQASTYSGGFILREGIVQWASSGSNLASPLGTGPLHLYGGQIRSSTSSGRTINVPVILAGDVTFGSTDSQTSGFITVNSYSGSLETTLAADSRLNCLGQVSWNQPIHGSSNLTKAGPGLMHITEVSHSTFEGTFTVEGGILRLSGSLGQSPLHVESGARIEGLGAANAGLLARSGAIVQPGLDSTRGTLRTGTLNLQSGSRLSLHLDGASPSTSDAIRASGQVHVDGAVLEPTLLSPPSDDAVFVLVDNRSGQPVTGTLVHQGQPLPPGSLVTLTAGSGSHTFEITYSYRRNGFAESIALIPPGRGDGTDYTTWREAQFGQSSDPAGDPQVHLPGQLVSNLLRYALALDLAPTPAGAGDHMPTATATGLTFLRRSSLAARLSVERATTGPGGPWEVVATLEPGAAAWTGPASVEESAEAPGLRRVTVNDTGTPVAARWWRLRATLP